MKTRRMSELDNKQTRPSKLVMATGVTRRRISPRSLSKCQTERARKAKLISKSLFGVSNFNQKSEIKEQTSINDSENKSNIKWEFDFDQGKPMKLQRNYKWEAVSCDEVPKMYSVNHVRRLRSHHTNFEGQLPKLRYYHHIKKVEIDEENNNKLQISIKSQPITASAKKNEFNGQMKITDFLKEKKRLTGTRKKRN